MLSGGRCGVAVLAVLLMVPAACRRDTTDSPGPRIGAVAVGDQGFTITREAAGVCLRSDDDQARHCVRTDAGSSEPVVSAVLEPYDATSDVVVILTQADVAIEGLSPRAGHLGVVALGGGVRLTLWADLLPTLTPSLCATFARAGSDSGRLVVARSVQVDPAQDGTATAAADACR